MDNKKTYALIVGIEKYDISSEACLEGCVKSALDFRDWLEFNNNVPNENIFLYLSPKDNNIYKERIKSPIPQATYEGLKKRIHDLKKIEGDSLYFFWAGHGVLKNDNRLLYCADSKESREILNLDSILKFLQDRPQSNFPNQFGFVDACASDYNRLREEQKLPAYSFWEDKPYPQSNKNQYFFFASKKGQIANYEESGYFSDALLEEIKPKILPLNLEEVAKTLDIRFKELRSKGRITQTPAFYEYLGNGKSITEWIVELSGEQLRELFQKELIRSFDEEHLAKALLEKTGIETGTIKSPFAGMAEKYYWSYVIKKLESGIIINGMRNFVNAALEFHPGNEIFSKFRDSL